MASTGTSPIAASCTISTGGWEDRALTLYDKADLTGAKLDGAVLTGADLSGVKPHGEWHRGADLTGADLTGADLTGADLTGAVLTGADLRRANGLTQAQVDSAKGNKDTKLPKGLVRPEHWAK
jgi:uncharacterized protein YjbI with pentapeptide repeats